VELEQAFIERALQASPVLVDAGAFVEHGAVNRSNRDAALVSLKAVGNFEKAPIAICGSA
jgi:hypothetical protein